MNHWTPETFWAATEPVPNCGCWVWTRFLDMHGYGRTGNKQLATHRLSWELYRGPIPPGLWVLHKCDVRCCVNPDHLFLGTHADNMQDASRKGRLGGFIGKRRLQSQEIAAIRASALSSRKLARMHGVDQKAIMQILKYKTYKDLP